MYTQYTSQSLLNNSLLNYQLKGNYTDIEYVNTLSSLSCVYTQYTSHSLFDISLLNYHQQAIVQILNMLIHYPVGYISINNFGHFLNC